MFRNLTTKPVEPTAEELAEGREARRERARRARRTLLCAVLCLAGSVASIAALRVGGSYGLGIDGLTILLVLPGVLSMIVLRGHVRRWYRWAALWFLIMFAVSPQMGEVVLMVGHFWLLYVAWVIEKSAPVRGARLFRRIQRRQP